MDRKRYHTLPRAKASSAASKIPSDVSQPGTLEQTQSQRRLRASSPRWKEHYSKLSEQWSSGISFAQQESNLVWEDIRQQKEKGGYPWTHLSHHQDEEVWLNPQKLPQDIGSVTMLRKDNTIPKEWFHLPKGAEVPTVDDLLRESSPEVDNNDDEEAVARRAKSPPICGRQRSKSRDRVPQKYLASSTAALHQRVQTPMSSATNLTEATSISSFQHPNEQSDKLSADGSTEKHIVPSHLSQGVSVPVENESDKESDSDKSTSCFPVLRKSRSRSKSKERKLNKEKLKKKSKNKEYDNDSEINGKEDRCDKIVSYQGPQLLPKAGSGSPKPPPKVDRSSKPITPPVMSDEVDSYEPVENGTKHDDDGHFRDDSRVSGKRDSSRGSGYEPVGWGKDNITRANINGIRDELGSKIYEDLDEIDEKITQVPQQDILVSTETSGEEQILEKECKQKEDTEREKETVHREKEENSDHVKTIKPQDAEKKDREKITQKNKVDNEEQDTLLKEATQRKQKEKDQQQKEEIAKKQQLEQEAKEQRARENMGKEQMEREEKEKKRQAKEQKEKDEKLKKEQKEAEEREARERKARQKMEKDQAEMEAKEKKKLAREQKEKDEKLRKEQKEAEELEENERKIKERVEKEQAEIEQKEKRKQAKEAKENEERMRKEQKEVEELETKERKAREKKEKERSEIIEKEKKRQAKEQKEKEEKLRKEQKEAREAEEKERKIREKIDKEEAENLEKEKKKQAKEQTKKDDKLTNKPGSFELNLSKSKDENVDEMIKNEAKLEKLNKDNETELPGRDDSENETEIQNYDIQEAPKMIAKERAFDEENLKGKENIETTDLIETNDKFTDSIEYEHIHQACINTNEQEPTLEASTQINIVNEIESENEGDKDKGYLEIESKPNLNPFEEDENDLASEALLIDTNTASDKDFEIQSHLVQQNTKLELHPSFPSDNQITEEYSRSDLTNANVNLQNTPLINSNEMQSIHTLQISLETVDKLGNEKHDANQSIPNEFENSFPQDADRNESFSKTKKEKKTEEKEAKKKIEKDLKERKKKEKEDDERRKKELKELKKDKTTKKKEENEMKKQMKEEAKTKKAEEKETLKLKNENIAQQQKELKERWAEKEKDDTLNRQTKLDEKNNKKEEEHEMNKRLKEEEEKKKIDDQETLKIKNENIAQQQKELKERWSEKEKDDTLNRQTKLDEKISKKKEENEMNKRLKREEEKKKVDNEETLKMKHENIAQQQKQLNERWVEQENDDTLNRQTKLDEKISKKNEENEMNKRLKEEEEKKKVDDQETLKLQNENIAQQQKELKERWVEKEKDDSLNRQTKLDEKISKKKEENEMNKQLKEEKEKKKVDNQETLKLKNENIAQQQKELKERWVEQEKDDTLNRQTKLDKKTSNMNEENEMNKRLKEEEEEKKAEKGETLRLKNESIAEQQKELKERWDEQEKDDTMNRQTMLKEETSKKTKENEMNKRIKEEEEEEKKKAEESEALRLKHDNVTQQQKELKGKWVEQEKDDNKQTEMIEETNKKNNESEMKKRLKEEAKKQMAEEKIALQLRTERNTQRQKELKQRWIKQENERKNKINEMRGHKNETKINTPEIDSCIVSPLPQDEIPENVTSGNSIENMKLNVPLESMSALQSNADVPEEVDTISCEDINDLENQTSGIEEAPTIMDDDINITFEQESQDIDGTLKHDSMEVEKVEKHQEDLVEKVEKQQEDLVAKVEKQQEDLIEKVEKQQEDLVENIDHTERNAPVLIDEPEELNILIEILKGNRGTVPHFSTKDDVSTEDTRTKVPIENDDPEELKLLISMLNTQHEPPENVSEPERGETAILKEEKEKQTKLVKSKDEKGEKQKNLEETKVKDEKDKQMKLAKAEQKRIEKQNKLDSKKLKYEKDKQTKLENEQKKKIENKNKLEEKKHQEEKHKQIQLVNIEEQKTLKEKWSKQEQEKKENENQCKTGKAASDENTIVTPGGIGSEPEEDDLPEIQVIENVIRETHEQIKVAKGEELRTEKQNKLEEKKLKDEKSKQMKLEKAKAKRVETQNKLDAKKHEEEKHKQIQLVNIEEQKTLKGKWSKQEQEKKENETQCKTGKAASDENTIVTPGGIGSELEEDDLPEIQVIENVIRETHEQTKVAKEEELRTEKENKLEEKKLKDEKSKQMKSEKAEAKRVENQNKLEAKKHEEEKHKQVQLTNAEKQKTLKEKWNHQEQDKKENKSKCKKRRAEVIENAIPTPEGICSEPAKDDLPEIQISENVNPLLMEYAESISSDIMKEAKGKNALEFTDEVEDEPEQEMAEQKRSEKSSKDEGLPPVLRISDENISKIETVPIMPHADVEKILQIIKETDDEFREKELQLLDDIERKRKEENIKEMEKELKKQKKVQEKLKKENEKAQKKRDKMEKEAQLKQEKEEKQVQKKMEAKLKKEQEAECLRIEQESKAEKKKKLPVDSEAQKQIDKEKQLAIEKEMNQYRITPDVEEELNIKLSAAEVCDTNPNLDTKSEGHEIVDDESMNPFQPKVSHDDTTQDIQESAKKVDLVAPKLKDEPKHVKWTNKILPRNIKEFNQSGVGAHAEHPISKTQQQVSSQVPKIASPLPAKELFLTQPEESESRATSVMATSAGGQRSPDELDDFAQFASGHPHQNGGGVSPDGIEPDYGYEDDEMDFTPQNGYVADEQEFVAYHEEEPQPTVDKKAPKERKSREPMKMPTVDIKGKLDAIKGIKMPSAHDMAESLNPMTSLKRPLGVRVREEDPDIQKQRALIVKNKTPGELGNLKHPLDIPMPKFRNRNKSAEACTKVCTAKKVSKPEDNEKERVKEDTSTPGKGVLFNTLPRSLRQQNLVTSVKEMDDPKVLEERQELIKNYSPAQLAQIKGISDFPVPSKITNMFEKKEKEPKRAPSADHEKSAGESNEPWSLYGTLPRSMRETKLLTNTREMLDPKELEQRQELIRSKSPTELAQFHGVEDIPVPTKIQNIFKSRSRSGSLSKMKRTRSESLNKGSASMTFTLPKAWAETKLITQVKVEEDEAVLAHRRNLTETKTPNELSQITSIADLPIPSALENFLKSDKKPKEGTRDECSSPIRINLDNMYDNLPRSLQQQLLVKAQVEEDEEVVKKRQELVATKKPAELAQIGGLSDFPVPTALENIFKSGPPKPPRRQSRDERDGKRKRNFTTGGILSYDNIPDHLTQQLLVKTIVDEDPEVLQARQELTRTKTPNELGQIHGLADFPLPEKIDTLMRPSKRNLKSTKEKQLDKKRSLSWSSLPGKISNASLPTSFKTELLVKARMEDPEVQKERQEIVNTKSVAELGEIHGLSDFPIPKTLERLVDKSKRISVADNKSEDTRPLKDKMYDTLPKSMKTELLVKVRDEDPEVQKQRQELTRSKSPVELSQMSCISDFPVPTNIEKLLQKTSSGSDGAPVPPPRRARLENLNKEHLYETFPSLNKECMVRSRVIDDEEVIKQRKELISSKTTAELSQIHGLDDFPVPTFVEQGRDSLKRIRTRSTERKEGGEGGMKGMYEKVPESLKCQLLVKATYEDPELQKERAETVKTKSVNELSQVTALSEFPVPESIERLISRQPGACERKKLFREKQRSLSAKNLHEMLPESLNTKLLVKSKTEKPEVQRERAQLVSSKSVSELSQVTSLHDFPVPTTIERLISKSKGDLTDGTSSQRTSRFDLANFNAANIYATLPKSMTEKQLLVRARVEDPEVQKSRKEVTEGKSVAELSQIHSMAEFPIPATIETIIEKGRQSAQGFKDPGDRSAMSSPAQCSMKDSIYATLPRSLKQELAVTTKIQDPERVQERRETVANKSVNELSQVTSLSDVPIPTPIMKMIDTAQNLRLPKTEGDEQSKSRPVSRGAYEGNIYASLPRSLKKELLVRSKVEEDEEKLKSRQNLVETKTPAELSQIHSLAEVPLPRRVEAWLHHNDEQSSLPRNKQDIKDIVYKSILPESMTKPCVVRSRIEDPEVLLKRQELQQEKSIHELSKIRNLNEFPLPMNIKLPDIPLPSLKGKNILKMIAPTKNGNGRTKQNQEPYGEYTPASTPRTGDLLTDDDMLRYDASTPGGDTTHRDQDFGYEIIDESASPMISGAPQHVQQIPAQFREDILDQASPQSAVEEDSLAEQYRGTPPLKSKKKKPDRRSHEVPDHVQLGDEIPPPLPPKRPSAERRLRNSPGAAAGQVFKSSSASRVPGSFMAQDEFLSCADDPNPLQNLQLPGAPSSAHSSVRHSGSGHSFASARSGVSNHPEQFHSVASTLHSGTLVDSNNLRRDDDENTLADSIVDSMHSCADGTIRDEDLHSCADTLAESDDEVDFGDSPTPPVSSG